MLLCQTLSWNPEYRGGSPGRETPNPSFQRTTLAASELNRYGPFQWVILNYPNHGEVIISRCNRELQGSGAYLTWQVLSISAKRKPSSFVHCFMPVLDGLQATGRKSHGKKRAARAGDSAESDFLFDVIPRHPPGTVSFFHRSDGFDGRFLLLKRSLKLDHHVFTIRGAGQRGSVLLRFEPPANDLSQG